MDIQEKNQLIADFMGFEYHGSHTFNYIKVDDRMVQWNPDWDYKDLNEVFFAVRHTDRDKYKKDSFTYRTSITDQTVAIYKIGSDKPVVLVGVKDYFDLKAKFTAIYEAVVEFIQWYNQNEK